MLTFFNSIITFNKTHLTFVYLGFLLLSAILTIYSYIFYKYYDKINFCSFASFSSFSIISTWVYIFSIMFKPVNDILLNSVYIGYPFLFVILLDASICFNVEHINKKN